MNGRKFSVFTLSYIHTPISVQNSQMLYIINTYIYRKYSHRDCSSVLFWLKLGTVQVCELDQVRQEVSISSVSVQC